MYEQTNVFDKPRAEPNSVELCRGEKRCMNMNQRLRAIYRVTFIGLVVNLVLAAGKLAAGLVGRSGAMIADAVHSLSDMATDVVVLVFAKLSAKPEDATHNFGHGKYETLATVIISLFLAGVGVGILWESIGAIIRAVRGEGLPRPGFVALLAAVVSIVVKELLYQYTVREGRRLESSSVVANAWHHRSDAFSSIGTFIGIGCAYFLGEKWRVADPVVAAIVSLFIFKIACDLIRDGFGELLERSLPADVEQEMRGIIVHSPEVHDLHALRTRRIGPVMAVDAHIRVDGAMEVERSHELVADIERRLRERFGGRIIATIQVEPFIGAGDPSSC